MTGRTIGRKNKLEGSSLVVSVLRREKIIFEPLLTTYLRQLALGKKIGLILKSNHDPQF